MKHGFLDEHAYADSLVHKLDSRVKIIAFLGGIVVCVTTPAQHYTAFAVYAMAIIALLAVSGLPMIHVLRRLAVAAPFVLMVVAFAPFLDPARVGGGYSLGTSRWAGHTGASLVVWNVTVKAFLSMSMATLLTSTTPFPSLLHGMRRLRFPEIIVMLLSFAYRYIFVMIDEFERLLRARASRGYSGRWIWHASSLGKLIGNMFIRTYDRSERVYVAMISRGYNGSMAHVPQTALRPSDGIFMLCFLGLLTTARFLVQ